MLSITNLSLIKSTRKKVSHLISDISLNIPRGKITLFLGKSGSGKTTILRCISQLEKKYQGEILYETQNLRELSPKERCQIIGFVPQSYALFPFMNVLTNCIHPLQTVLRVKKEAAMAKATKILNDFGMGQLLHSYPHQLSGGQQQRVALARALALNPTYLLLDEPTSALDPENTSILIQILQRLTSEGKAVIISSQDMHFAEKILENVYFLENGRIVEQHHNANIETLTEESRLKQFVTL